MDSLNTEAKEILILVDNMAAAACSLRTPQAYEAFIEFREALLLKLRQIFT